MDNARIHGGEMVRHFIESKEAQLTYLQLVYSLLLLSMTHLQNAISYPKLSGDRRSPMPNA